MASNTQSETIDLSLITDGLITVMTAPAVFLVAAAVEQPLVQTAIRESVILSERMKESLAKTGETLEDLVAEAHNQLQQSGANSYESSSGIANESEVAVGISSVLAGLNDEIHNVTQGVLDLRALVPLGLAALALRQLLIKGLQIEEIPWYTLAWYAFDSFIKLNSLEDVSPFLYPPITSEEISASSNGGAD